MRSINQTDNYIKNKMRMQCRIAPSLGAGFAGTPNEVWGTVDYTDPQAPAVFFGLYGLPDFYTLWRHKGEKYILWAGSDIRHFTNGYWLDDKGDIRLVTAPLVLWIIENCHSYVENEVERAALAMHGILSTIVPSFLGNIQDYPVSFKKQDKVRLYTSVSGNEFDLYGWPWIVQLAVENPDVEFHLYGNTLPWPNGGDNNNIIVHGRVPIEQMNAETKEMTGALRLTEFDGFSEILAKSILWGQYPVSRISYPYMLEPEDIKMLKYKSVPNPGRNFYVTQLNKYPWNVN